MKKLLTLLAINLTLILSAQAPEKMSYQAVVRNSGNQVVQNGTVGLRVSILQGSPSGTTVYEETHAPLTNGNGLFSIEIGGGTIVSGAFTSIDWKNGQYWLQTEVDPAGGTDYSITSVSQLLSVPYALHSKYADLSGTGIDNVIDNGDGTLTFEFVNGTEFTSPVLTGLQGPAGVNGQDGTNGIDGQNGANGTDGVSVTSTSIQNDSLYVSLSNGQTLNAGYVRGAQGPAGLQGLPGNDGANGSPGTNGIDGTNGTNGTNGANGVDGISVLNSYIQNDSLRLVLSNGQTINAGHLAGVSITNTVIQNDSLIVSLSNGQTINAGYLNCPGQNSFLPSITTLGVNNITQKSAVLTYEVTDDGGEFLLNSGICIATHPNPTYRENNYFMSTGYPINVVKTASIHQISNILKADSTYYVRTFATNTRGTVYGNEISFTTLPPCLAPGTYPCSIHLTMQTHGLEIVYNETITSSLIVNEDLTVSLIFSDPNLPFACTNFTLTGPEIQCEDQRMGPLNYQTSSCLVQMGTATVSQNYTVFTLNSGYMYNYNTLVSYNAFMTITLQ